ncbi:5-dehydro-4-deoxyglucarate dehydratase [Micrococcales bacterium 31B]|nr:5-dehydro-4-deoxyglucarate dehydratase [Micrococcales bacterium 31B]
MQFNGILFFPVTPFDQAGQVDTAALATHLEDRLEYGIGGVFPACGTGEVHALSADEVRLVVETTVRTVGGRVPVLGGAGGPLGHAIACARAAEAAGADGLLLLPPYLVGAGQAGLIRYVEAITAATTLPVVIYHRANAQYTPATVAHLAKNPQVVGFKDGVGDLGVTQEIVRTVAESGRTDFQFFNGLLTAEMTQGAFRGIGVPLYSSAAFAFAPDIAMAYYDAYTSGNEERRLELLDTFFRPLVKLRDRAPGYAVALIKAGVRAGGLDVGGVRAPLTDPTADEVAELNAIVERTRALLLVTA